MAALRSFASLPGPKVVLRNRAVLFFVISRFLSGTATTLLRAAVAWEVFRVTNSAFHLGLVGLVQFLPVIPCSLLGGVVADNLDRRRIVMLAQGTSLLAALTLVLLYATSRASTSAIYVTVFFLAVATSFESPARSALLPTLVPREQFPAAVAIHSSFMNLSWVTGPVVAGFVIHASGALAAFAVAAFAWAGSILTLGKIGAMAPPPRTGFALSAVGEGIAYVWRQRALLGAMTLDMFAVIFASATALLPVYASDILAVGPKGYGLLSSAFEIGTLCMAGILIVAQPIERAGRTLLIAVVIYGLATMAFGLSRSFPLSIFALAVAGMADEISVVTRSTIIQLSTPDALRGRVSSIHMIFVGASNQLGSMRAGFVAAATSPTLAVTGGGAGCLLVVAIVALTIPALVQYRVGGRKPG